MTHAGKIVDTTRFVDEIYEGKSYYGLAYIDAPVVEPVTMTNERVEMLTESIREHANTLRDLAARAEKIRGYVKEMRAELASIRAAEKAKKRRESKPAYDAVRERKEAMQKRLEDAVPMREAGLTYADIGAAWGIGADRAREIVKRAERIAAFKASADG